MLAVLFAVRGVRAVSVLRLAGSVWCAPQLQTHTRRAALRDRQVPLSQHLGRDLCGERGGGGRGGGERWGVGEVVISAGREERENLLLAYIRNWPCIISMYFRVVVILAL